MGTGRGYTLNAQVSSPANRPTTWTARTEYYNDEFDGWRWDVSSGLTVRPAPRWQASIDPSYSRAVDARQYIATRTGGTPATFGERYIFAYIERSTLSARLRLNYALTPNFTIEGYAEPFAASGRYHDFGELPRTRSRELRVYGAPGTGTSITADSSGYTVQDGAQTFIINATDFQRLSFRSNLVLRWEWLPGSTAFLIWQQNRQRLGEFGEPVSPRDLWGATRTTGDNFFVIKVSYWLGVT
jgi:hypothetical protein